MVKINRIYTRTGDDGTTGLVGGSRANKDSLRMEAVGSIDALIVEVGAACTICNEPRFATLALQLSHIQNTLFDLGSIAAAPADQHNFLPLVTELDTSNLEQWIDEYTAQVEELRSFVLPGGTDLNCALHRARVVTRNTERELLRLSRVELFPQAGLVFINRLSDYFFAAARYSSKVLATPEYLWRPGAR